MNLYQSCLRFAKIYLAGFLLLAACVGIVAQSERRLLTLEWIFGPEGRAVASVPQTAWLDDGSLVIFDNRRPTRERTFDRLNPATG